MDIFQRPQNHPKRILARWLLIIGVLLLTIALAIPYCIPKTAVEKILSNKVDGTVKIGSMQLSLFSGQKFFDIEIHSPKVEGGIHAIEIEGNFYTLLLFPSFLTIKILQPELTFIPAVKTHSTSSTAESWNLPSTPKIEVFNGTIRSEKVLFSSFQGEFQSSSSTITGSLQSTLESEKQIGDIRSSFQCLFQSSTFKNFFKDPSKMIEKLNTLQGSIQIHTDKLPLQWLGDISDFLGDHLNSDISIEMHQGLFASFDIKSPKLTALLKGSSANNRLHIESASHIEYVLTNPIMKHLSLDLSLTNPCTVEALFGSSSNWKVQLQNPFKCKTSTNTTLSITQLIAKKNEDVLTLNGELTQPEGKGSILMHQQNNRDWDFAFTDISTSWAEIFEQALGTKAARIKELGPLISSTGSYLNETFLFNLQAKNLQLSETKLLINPKVIQLTAPVTLKSPFINLDVQTFIYKQNDYALSLSGTAPEVAFHYPEINVNILLEELLIEKKLAAPLTGNFRATFSHLTTTSFPLSSSGGTIKGDLGGTLQALQCKNLRVEGDNLQIETSFLVQPSPLAITSTQPLLFTLKMQNQFDLTGTVTFYATDHPFATHSHYKTKANVAWKNQEEKKEGHLTLNLDLNLTDNQIDHLDLNTSGTNLPIEWVYPDATLWIGENIDFQIQAKGAKEKEVEGQIKLFNPFVSINLFGNISKEGFTLSKSQRKSTIEYSFKPFKDLSFLKKHALKISSSGTLKLECNTLFFPFNEDLSKLEFVANLEGKNLAITNTQNHTTALFPTLSAEIDKRPLAPFVADLSLRSSYLDKEGTLTAHLSHPTQDPDSMQISINCENFPLLNLANIGAHLSTNFLFDVTKKSGTSTLQLATDNLQLKAAAEIRNGILSFTPPLEGQVKNIRIYDSELERGVFVPFTIPTKGVSIPLFPLNIGKMQIPKLLLGSFQLSAKVQGNTQALFNALNMGYTATVPVYCVPLCSENRHLSSDKRPASLSIIDGILYLPRLDLLLENRIWIVLWGSTNLKTGHTTLYLGITGQTLTNILGIQQLAPNFVLPIKIEGQLDNLTVSKQDIVAAIAYLTAKLYAQMITPVPGLNLDILFNQSSVPPMRCPPPWN